MNNLPIFFRNYSDKNSINIPIPVLADLKIKVND